MKQERNESPQLVTTIQAQQHEQHDEVGDLYHTQMEVHHDDVLDVHTLQA
jgi:hypothetical protein